MRTALQYFLTAPGAFAPGGRAVLKEKVHPISHQNWKTQKAVHCSDVWWALFLNQRSKMLSSFTVGWIKPSSIK